MACDALVSIAECSSEGTGNKIISVVLGGGITSAIFHVVYMSVKN